MVVAAEVATDVLASVRYAPLYQLSSISFGNLTAVSISACSTANRNRKPTSLCCGMAATMPIT